MEAIDQDEIELAEALFSISNETGGKPPVSSVPESKIKVPSKTLSEQLHEILKSHHGDNYHLGNNVLLILYPEITLTNSDGTTHVIKDLVVKFRIRLTSTEFKLTEHAIYGKRMTKNVAEWARGYEHSHLPLKSPHHTDTGYQTFCLGYSQIKITLDRLIRYDKDTCLDQFELLLHQTDEYVSWESLEGGPHDLMANIVLNNNNSIINISQVSAATYKLFEKISQLPINIVKYGEHLKLNPSLELLEAMYKIYSDYPSVMLDGKIQDNQSKFKYGSVAEQQHVLSRHRVPQSNLSFNDRIISFTVEIVNNDRESEILTINELVYRRFFLTFNNIINNPTFKITPDNVKKEIAISQG